MKNYPDFLLRKDDLNDGKKWGRSEEKNGRSARVGKKAKEIVFICNTSMYLQSGPPILDRV